MNWWRNEVYVSAGQRRAQAKREAAKLTKEGRQLAPIAIEGRAIAASFWGKAWCQHLESYSDFSNRLPRGRTYVRNGSVVDLQIEPGKISALVSGSEMYEIEIEIESLESTDWKSVIRNCSGRIGSLLELLQGRLSDDVMLVVTHREQGLFPKPREISMQCSCPDWAGMCKHLAAVLYGVGARLDSQPELLFLLRQVDHNELIAGAADLSQLGQPARGGKKKTIAAESLADVFGIEMEGADAEGATTPARTPKTRGKPKAKKTAAPKARVRRAPPAATNEPAVDESAVVQTIARAGTKSKRGPAKQSATTKKKSAVAPKSGAKQSSAIKPKRRLEVTQVAAKSKGKTARKPSRSKSK